MTYSHPAQWVPDAVILEGMSIINTSPLVTHSSMKNYARFLIKRFAVPCFINGVSQVSDAETGADKNVLRSTVPISLELRSRVCGSEVCCSQV